MLLTGRLFLSILNNDKLVNDDKQEHFHNRRRSSYVLNLILGIILIICGITMMVSSAIVAYKCNHRENMFIKIIIIIFALLFYEFYIPYYLIKYVILERKCGSNVLIRNMAAPPNRNNRRNNRR